MSERDAPKEIWLDKRRRVHFAHEFDTAVDGAVKYIRDDGWQPIATARETLTDTRSRLIWCPENRCIFCVTWQKGDTHGHKEGWAIFGGGWQYMLQLATHWMPLPEPPKED